MTSNQLCPYFEHAPQTIEGFEVLDVIEKCGGSAFKFHPNGRVLGFDTPTLLKAASILGYGVREILLLLHYAELGLLDAMEAAAKENKNLECS